MGELGTRYKCYKCDTKFYDLGRPQPLCPSCGEDQSNKEVKVLTKKKRVYSLFKKDTEMHPLHGENDDYVEPDEIGVLAEAGEGDEADHEKEETDHDDEDADREEKSEEDYLE